MNERGPRGQHGEKGDPGTTGDPGQTGTTGKTGKTGETGTTGAAGESAPYLGRRQTLAIFTFIVLAFVLLAYRSEISADRISDSNARITTTQRETRESGLEILIKFNLQQDALIEVERANPFIDDKVRAARIKAYNDARIDPLPICEEARR